MFYRANQKDLPPGFINSCDVPRSIFWITTLSKDRVVNLSPWSFSGAVAYEPGQVFFAVTGLRKDGREADTLVNVRETGEFVVNFPTYDTREQMNLSSASVKAEVDETKLAGLETVESILVDPPGIKVSPARLECRLYEIFPLLGENNRLVVGEVVGYYIQDQYMKNGKVDWLAYSPIARMGRGDCYTVVRDVFSMRRPEESDV